MRTLLLVFISFGIFTPFIYSQDGEAPNFANSSQLSPGVSQASRINSGVNLFTGLPNLSIPIYNFRSNTGIGVSVTIDYTGGGGIQVSEAPSYTGLGWYLNAGGIITRTVRGLPDDIADFGFMYAGAIPTDFRTNANKYYCDSLDSQQDIFQYNLPGSSGQFYIGKNGQIVMVPLSKIRVIPTFQTPTIYTQTLKSFRIVTEDGIKYDFDDAEYATIYVSTSGYPSGYLPPPCVCYLIH